MKKQTISTKDSTLLRQKAEDQLKHKQSNKSLSFSEAETLKLIHELEVHQIELEMQNEELCIAKEKAELAEEKYTDIYDFAPSGYLSISKDGKIVELNFAAAHMLGKVRSKLKNRCFAFYLSQESLPVFNLFVQKVFTNKVKQACEVIITNEVTKPIYVNIEGILSQNDELCHLTLSDITERKKAEQELVMAKEKAERNEMEIKKAQEIAHLGSWYLNVKTNEVVWTEELYKMYGFDPTIPPPPYTEHMKLFTPESWDTLSTSLAKTRETGIPYELELKTVRIDNSKGWMWVRGEAVLDESKNIIGLWGAAQDITERKKSEEALQKSEAKLSALFSSMSEMVVLHELVYDKERKPANYRITDCNEAFTRITGISRKTAVGRLSTEVYGTKEAPYLNEYSKVVLTGKAYRYETYFPPMDKHFSISVISYEKNCFATVTTDITELKKAETDIIKLNESLEQRVLDRTKQLEESNKALEAFSHSISHDLRAPLRSIVGFSQILIEEYQPILGSEGSRLLQIVIDSTKKMNDLIEGLLKISKVNYVKVDKVIIDMNQILAYVLSNVHNFFDTSKVSFQIENLQEGLGDPTLIGQVWFNLIANAVKFSSKHPTPQITIQSYKKDNDIVYLIKDNGTGFKQEYKDKVFTIFNRFHSSEEYEGTGVGLSLVHRIIQKHGGTIWAESTEGKGATFYFSLPLSST